MNEFRDKTRPRTTYRGDKSRGEGEGETSSSRALIREESGMPSADSNVTYAPYGRGSDDDLGEHGERDDESGTYSSSKRLWEAGSGS